MVIYECDYCRVQFNQDEIDVADEMKPPMVRVEVVNLDDKPIQPAVMMCKACCERMWAPMVKA